MKPVPCRATSSNARTRWRSVAVAACSLAAPLAVLHPGDTEPTSEKISAIAGDYGFQSMVSSKLGESVSNLTPGDIDGDGRGDLAIVANSRAKIELLTVPKAGELAGDGNRRPAS